VALAVVALTDLMEDLGWPEEEEEEVVKVEVRAVEVGDVMVLTPMAEEGTKVPWEEVE